MKIKGTANIKKVIRLVVVCSFIITSVCGDMSYAGGLSGRNLSPQSVFNPLEETQIHDIAMLEYTLTVGLHSGNFFPMKENFKRNNKSFGVDLSHEEREITYRFDEAIDHKKDNIRLIPCTFTYKGESSTYWCLIERSRAVVGGFEINFFTDEESRKNDIVSRIKDLRREEREEIRAIELAERSERIHDEKIREAIRSGKVDHIVVDSSKYPISLSIIYQFLARHAPKLTHEFHELVENGQLMVIKEKDPRFALREPHAGGQGIYLPDSFKYANSETIVHEIFAKAGFTHDEANLLMKFFEAFCKSYLSDNFSDIPIDLPEDALKTYVPEKDVPEMSRLISEAQDARFVKNLPRISSRRDYSMAQKRRDFEVRKRSQEVRYLKVYEDVSRILHTSGDLDEISDVIRKGLGYHGVNIGILSEDGGRLKIAGASTEWGHMAQKAIKSFSFDLRKNEEAFKRLNELEGPVMIEKELLLEMINKESRIASWILSILTGRISKSILGQMLLLPISDPSGKKMGAILLTKPREGEFLADEIELVENLCNNISLGIIRNVSQERIKVSEEKHRNIFDSSPETILTISSEMSDKGVITSCNARTEELTGYSREELIGKNFKGLARLGLFNISRIGEYTRIFNSVRKGTSMSEPFSTEITTKGGETRNIEVKATLIPTSKEIQVIIVDRTMEIKREKEIVSAKEFLRRVIDNISDPVFVKDEDHRWVLLNDAACETMGRPREDLIGKTDFDIYPDEQAEVFWKKDDEVLKSGKPVINEESIEWHGENHTVVTSKTLYVDASNGKKYIIGVSHDITDRKRAEQDILKFKIILERSNEGFAMSDLEGNITYVNKSFAEMHGFTVDELIGKHFSICHNEEQMSKVNGMLEKLMIEGSAEQEEVWHLRKDGTVFPTLMSTVVIKDDAGNPLFLSATAIDITERKKMEESIIASMRQSNAWLENSPVCTKIVDLDLNLQYMSRAGVEGLNIDDITPFYGKPYPFDFYPESFRNTMTENLKKAKETGEVIEQEAPVVDVDGNELWFHSTIVPVKDEEGQIEYLMVISSDTTERKKAEKELKTSEEIMMDERKETPESKFDDSEQEMKDEFNASPVGIAVYGSDGSMQEANKAYLELFGSAFASSMTIFDIMEGLIEEHQKIKNSETVSVLLPIGAKGVIYNVTPFGEKGTAPFGYMVQAQTVEDYENALMERRKAEERTKELNALSRRDKSNMLQSSSAEKVALVYGENYHKAVKILGAIGFRGEIVVARTEGKLKELLSSGDQFDIIINTTSEDIKKILANMDIHIEIVDELTDTNNLQNTLLEICA